jgi:hypothetical protein
MLEASSLGVMGHYHASKLPQANTSGHENGFILKCQGMVRILCCSAVLITIEAHAVLLSSAEPALSRNKTSTSSARRATLPYSAYQVLDLHANPVASWHKACDIRPRRWASTASLLPSAELAEPFAPLNDIAARLAELTAIRRVLQTRARPPLQ